MERPEIRMPCKFASLLGMSIAVIGLMSGAYGIVYDAAICRAAGIVFTFMGFFISLFFKGSCTAEDEGLVIKMPMRETRVIPYDDIDWVTLDVRRGSKGNSRGMSSSSYPLIYNIKIVTKTDTLSFEVSHGYTNTPSDLYDIRRKEMLLLDSPYKEMERVIRRKKGMEPDMDMKNLAKEILCKMKKKQK